MESPHTEIPSAVLRHILAERGLSQSELARKAGISPAAVSYYCSGERAMSLVNAARIAGALGISLEHLATGRDPSPDLRQPRHLFLRGAMGVGKSEILQAIVQAYPASVAGL